MSNLSEHAHIDHRKDSHGTPSGRALTRLAAVATAHCLTGCAIGEIAGLAIGTAAGWGNAQTIVLAIALAFVFGYSFTAVPLLRSGLPVRSVVRLALAADTVSIAVMEAVDNAVMVVVPGAMTAGLGSGVFWATLGAALVVAFVVTVPVNRVLIARGRGHAVVHGHH